MIVFQLVVMKSQRVPHAGENRFMWNVSSSSGDAQCGQSKTRRRDRSHSAAIAKPWWIEGLRAVQYLSIVRIRLFKKKHARAPLEIIEKSDVFRRERICSGRDGPNL